MKFLAVFLCIFLVNSASFAQKKTQEQSSVYTLSPVTITEESSDELQAEIKALAENMADPIVVKDNATAILQQVTQGVEVSEYDFLWAPYALLKVAYAGSGSGLAEADELVIALSAIDYLDENGVGDWQFTEPGQFKMEVYRTAANAAAWSLRESDPERALQLVEQGLDFARPEDKFMQDTQVRILLNLGEKNKAFTVVRQVLEEDPGFTDFQDFTNNEEYLSWLKKN